MPKHRDEDRTASYRRSWESQAGLSDDKVCAEPVASPLLDVSRAPNSFELRDKSPFPALREERGGMGWCCWPSTFLPNQLLFLVSIPQASGEGSTGCGIKFVESHPTVHTRSVLLKVYHISIWNVEKERPDYRDVFKWLATGRQIERGRKEMWLMVKEIQAFTGLFFGIFCSLKIYQVKKAGKRHKEELYSHLRCCVILGKISRLASVSSSVQGAIGMITGPLLRLSTPGLLWKEIIYINHLSWYPFILCIEESRGAKWWKVSGSLMRSLSHWPSQSRKSPSSRLGHIRLTPP